MSVTINGQLMLLMLLETLHENLDVEIIYENTDGFTVLISPEDKAKLEEYVTKWENTTKLTMEYQLFDSLFIRDVNNIIATSGEYVKLKGAYEVDKKIGDEPVLHKDTSMRAVRLAVKQYFVDGIPVEESLKANTNIYDFCLNKQAKKGWFFSMSHTLTTNDIKLKNIKTVRYYVSNQGSIIYKNHEDGRKHFLEAGLKGKENRGHYWKLRLFNKFKEKTMEEYNIDYSYYLRESQKLIDAIEKHTIQPEKES